MARERRKETKTSGVTTSFEKFRVSQCCAAEDQGMNRPWQGEMEEDRAIEK